jgi:hypothetical protein
MHIHTSYAHRRRLSNDLSIYDAKGETFEQSVQTGPLPRRGIVGIRAGRTAELRVLRRPLNSVRAAELLEFGVACGGATAELFEFCVAASPFARRTCGPSFVLCPL